jgi:hypothetical protein
VKVDGKTIKRGAWRTGDAWAVRNTVIVGRALVELEDGSVINAFVVASQEPRTLGQKYAVYWEWQQHHLGDPFSRVVALELAEDA